MYIDKLCTLVLITTHSIRGRIFIRTYIFARTIRGARKVIEEIWQMK